MTPIEAAAALSLATGREFSFVRDLAGGETGAQEFAESGERRWVIKWVSDPAAQERRQVAVDVSERLRIEAQWPAPFRECISTDEHLFVLQEFVPGASIDVLTDRHVDSLLACHQRRLGLRSNEPSEFAEHLIHTLVEGGTGYCVHESLRTHDDRTRAFLTRVRAIGAALHPDDLPSHDLIHWDLHHGNLIERDGELVGIIDMDNAKVGDGRCDLTMLALMVRAPGHSQSVRDRLFEVGIAALPDKQREAFVAHFIVRLLDWAVRKRRPADIEFWLRQADELL